MERESWIDDLESEMARFNEADVLERQKRRSIYTVPNMLRDSGDAYTPQLLSLGPYHHHRDHLKQMDKHKHVALSNYLRRANTTLVAVAEAMRLEVKGLIESYDGLQDEWMDETRFLKLMILDGCFFLDVKIWHSALFSNKYMSLRLQTDMLLVENQLPLAVLALLIDMGGNKVEDTVKFMQLYGKHQPGTKLRSVSALGLHHLDIHWKDAVMHGGYWYDPDSVVRSATELFEGGIHFRRNGTSMFNDISFDDGILRLPCLRIHYDSETWLLNFIAYEAVRNVEECGVTSYALLMGNLIKNANDVTMLRNRGIIKGYIGSDDEVASLFNHLVQAITISRGEGRVNVNRKLEDYCRHRPHRWRASFVLTYMNSPWVFISVVGAFVLLVSMVLRTVYTIIPYYHPK